MHIFHKSDFFLSRQYLFFCLSISFSNIISFLRCAVAIFLRSLLIDEVDKVSRAKMIRLYDIYICIYSVGIHAKPLFRTVAFLSNISVIVVTLENTRTTLPYLYHNIASVRGISYPTYSSINFFEKKKKKKIRAIIMSHSLADFNSSFSYSRISPL